MSDPLDNLLAMDVPVSDTPVPAPPLLDWLGLLPPVSAAAAAEALEGFVDGWFAEDPPGVAASWGPGPLRAFHRAAAGRDAVYGAGAVVYREPFEGRPRADGLVPFGQESEGVFQMLYDPADPALPVYYDYGDGPVREGDSLSAFLLHFALAEAAIGARIGGMAITTADEARRVTEGLHRVPLSPLSWPGAEMHTYVGPGLVVHAGRQVPDEEWHEVHVGARHRALLDPLRPIDLAWEVLHD
jgi:hypothetical protein